MSLARSSNPVHRGLAALEDWWPAQRTIRRAGPGDVERLSVLAAAAAHALCRPDYTAEQIETALRFGLRADAQLIADGTYYVIEHRGGIIAAGGWSFRAALMGDFHPDYDGGPRDTVDPALHSARLRGFFVYPGFARIGLGRMLVAHCERAALDAGFTSLELLATPAGRRLYLACGFSDLEPMTNFFSNGVSAPGWWMSKTIHACATAFPATGRSVPGGAESGAVNDGRDE